MTFCMKKTGNNRGFTLIELIVSLTIVALIGFGASSFLVYAANGFMLTRANIETYQKTNIAMERLIKEIKNIDSIFEISADSIRYQRDGQRFGIALVGSNIKLIRGNSIPNEGTGSILINNINAFSLEFVDVDGDAWLLPADNRLTGLSIISIQIIVAIENTTKTFTIQINPFYNEMVNGPT